MRPYFFLEPLPVPRPPVRAAHLLLQRSAENDHHGLRPTRFSGLTRAGRCHPTTRHLNRRDTIREGRQLDRVVTERAIA
ncbi:hypothetical protein OFC13_29165, partial [Escherichia coli]|nr:hypothetical protein [Escherichia coli]